MNLKLDDCACPDYKSGYQATRRSILKGLGVAAGSTVIAGTTDGIFRQVAFADDATAAASPSNIMVVVSLRGGADGLSMFVPYGDPGYYAARDRTAVPAAQLLAKDGFFGLHPSFASLMPMWNQGKMAAIHAVGLPTPNRSHFAAMEEIEDADPGSGARVGWLNRLTGVGAGSSSTEAVSLGSSMIPTSMYGPDVVLGLKKTASVGLPGSQNGPQAAWKRSSLSTLWAHDGSPLGSAGLAALDASNRLDHLAKTQPRPAAGANYPKTPFGDVMADTARLLKSGVGVRTVTVDFGGWDMHVGLGNLVAGTMKPQIAELADALAAFYTDLEGLRDNVTTVTLSEFGRRVQENDNAGFDHGFGNAMMVLGSGVKGGQMYGSWPGLQQGDLVSGDLSVTRDYRSVLTEVLRSRTTTNTSAIFPGFVAEQPLGFMV